MSTSPKKKGSASPSKPSAAAKTAVPTGLPGAPGSVDKIREILFGAQMQDYDKRFAHLEQRTGQRLAELERESGRRLDALEQLLARQVERLEVRLKEERQERIDGDSQLDKAVRDLASHQEKRLAQVSDDLAALQQELQQQLRQLEEQLRQEIRQRHDQLGRDLETAVARLSDSKTDRSALATLLVEMAMHLNQELAGEVTAEEQDG